MKSKSILLIAFAIVVIAQLFVPIQMISKQAGVANTGKEFRFKIGKIPNRSRPNMMNSNNQTGNRMMSNNRTGITIRGKYISFMFEGTRYKVEKKEERKPLQSYFVSFKEDSLGFAKIESVSKSEPTTGTDWIITNAYFNLNNIQDSSLLTLNYPFRYVIEDSKTNDIDSIIRRKLNDTLKVIYLKVKIKENQYVVNDLMIDSLTFKEFVENIRKGK